MKKTIEITTVIVVLLLSGMGLYYTQELIPNTIVFSIIGKLFVIISSLGILAFIGGTLYKK